MDTIKVEDCDLLLFNSTVITHKLYMVRVMSGLTRELIERGIKHDDSKLLCPEVDLFCSNIKLFTTVINENYGSGDDISTNQISDNIKKAKQLHYDKNPHHPEHYEDGINGMNLLDVMEMVSDWICSSNKYMNIEAAYEMLEVQRIRFKIDDQLYSIIRNTIPTIISHI